MQKKFWKTCPHSKNRTINILRSVPTFLDVLVSLEHQPVFWLISGCQGKLVLVKLVKYESASAFDQYFFAVVKKWCSPSFFWFLQVSWFSPKPNDFGLFLTFSNPKLMCHKQNIARVRNCPDNTISNSLFSPCLLSFCLFASLSFFFFFLLCFFSSFLFCHVVVFLYSVFLPFSLFVVLSLCNFDYLYFCLFVFHDDADDNARESQSEPDSEPERLASHL